jgi:tetratricopeptide (TPR) repeat protein
VDALYNKGLALASLGKREEAMECYDRVIEINPATANDGFKDFMCQH